MTSVPGVIEPGLIERAAIERVRWRCRRGLLELDIVLGRFVAHYANLDEKQRFVFDTLLDEPDTELWEMIGGKKPCEEDDRRALLVLINSV